MVERKLLHILDIARTLMFHAHLLKLCWGDVLAACCLINWMSFPSINSHIHISCLSHDALFHVIRIFGCISFMHALGMGLDKLSPRAIKCIFLWYSRTQKDYCCYDPITRKQYVSTNVAFFEDTPYFFYKGSNLTLTFS